MFMDAIHYHVCSEGQIVKKAVYLAIGIEYSAPERAPRPDELSSETGGVEQRFRCR